jgi:hypothetical protein
LRDKTGAEVSELKKSPAPIWSLAFCPKKFETSDNILAIGSWDQKLALYTVAGGKNFN